jgi:hypothetical protein
VIVNAEQLVGSFARHETFHPRYGWLRKAYEGARMGSDLFGRSDATVRLGVGKNMVNAIRHWGVAFDLLDEIRPLERKRVSALVPSALSEALFCDDGWDPYLEDPASLWLLHWRLLRPPCVAPVWWLAFNAFDPVQFREEQLLHAVDEVVDATPEWSRVAPGSIKKDVDCVLRMYAPAKAKNREGVEDVLDCPFRELGLLEPVPDEARTFRWMNGPKATLAPSIVAHAAVDFASRESAGSTVTLTRLATEPGGPGRAFKLSELALYEALVTASSENGGIEVVSPGGIRQMLISSDDPNLASTILETYYERTTGSTRRLASRPLVDVFREYEATLAAIDLEHDQVRALDLRDRRSALGKELAASGITV